MQSMARWLVNAAALALFTLSTVLGLWTPADAKLDETRFAINSRAPTGDIVLVDIDADSLLKVGRWPWPRSIHGRLLNSLMDMGAYEVAFDVDFSTRSLEAEDTAFAASLERAGGYAYLAAFRQLDSLGREVWNFPIADFATHADAALVNVDTLESGLVWSVPGVAADRNLQSIASLFAPETDAKGTIRIDYSIDLNQIRRIPASALLDGTVDPELVRDRQVVIGASALELHDLFLVPRFGVIPGPIVQIAAAETLKQDRSLTNFGNWPTLLLGLALLLGSILLPRLALLRVTASILAISLVAEITALIALVAYGMQFATMPLHAAAAFILITRLLEERSLRRRQLVQHRARLAYLANHDVRTGAMSHAAWLDEVEHRLETKPVWTLLLQLKGLDDAAAALGFEIAESVVSRFHERLQSKASGAIGRIESDIFALATNHALTDDRIQTLLSDLAEPYEIAGHRVIVELRWGSSDTLSAVEGLHHARMALAVSSHEGRQGVRYASTFDADVHYRQSIDLALRDAVAQGELDLVFQPQIDMKTRTMVGAEALLRWTSAKHGAVSPATFVPLAEQNGTIIDIGSWVAHEACRKAMDAGWEGRISINVSPVQFQHGDVVAMVASALSKSGFPAERLEVEVTESLLVQEGDIAKTLRRLRALGVSIAIDDFGTGYSSLSYLWSLPLDKLKIDQSFVRQLDNVRSASIVEAIVLLSHKLDLTIVVEGVETEEQCAHLSALGCQIAQGYLFGRPDALPKREKAA